MPCRAVEAGGTSNDLAKSQSIDNQSIKARSRQQMSWQNWFSQRPRFLLNAGQTFRAGAGE
jgi:hypothetical protein